MGRPRFAGVLAALALAAAGCGSSSSKTTPTSPESVATSLTISPNRSTLDPGRTVRLVAEVRDAGGALIAAPVEWRTAPSTIASVSGDGLVTGLAPGEATVTATSGNRSGTATIVVRNVYDV